jgi:AcrR family transcriptional regulator
MTVPTRERLLTAAMQLFSEQGYKETSVAQIEGAAGLAAGAGALYHHFKSKDAVLEAGIDRQLDRRLAMQDIRAMFAGLGDLHNELTVLGRYILAALDRESELLQISGVPPELSGRLSDAYAALFAGLTGDLADWIASWAPGIDERDAATIGAIGVNALLGKRATSMVFHAARPDVPDDTYLVEWTAMLANRIRSAQ